MRIVVAALYVATWVALTGCTEGNPISAANDAGHGSGGSTTGGASGLSESGAGGVTGGSGGPGGSGGDGTSAQPECPVAQSLPQDGAWTTTGRVIESDCPGIVVGTADTRFTAVTITTTALDGRVDRDLHLVAATDESFRGFVRDDEARLSGPLENYPDRPLNISLNVLFAGDCFTAQVREELMDTGRECSVNYFLLGDR